VVTAIRREWPGAVELDVTAGGAIMPALAYPALTGRPRVGDRVLLNATALELGLGTGGYALVVAVPELPGEFGKQVTAQAAPLGERHQLVSVPVDGLMEPLAGCPVRLSTMGRGLAEDRAYFLAAAAAGRHAARLLQAS